MSDVDYSEFYYHREPHKNDDEPRYERRDDKNVKRRRISSVISTVLIIAIICGFTFFAADFFMKGKLISEVQSAFRGNDYQYYLVVGDCDTKDRSYAQSLLIKQGGGSGYIISEDKYSVVYAPFTDRAEANAVAEKNKDTYVYVVEYSSKDVDYHNDFFTEIKAMLNALADYEKGRVTDSELYSVYNVSKGRISALDSEKLSDDKRAVIEYAVGSIEGLDFAKGSRIALMSDARYVLSGIIISLRKTA